MKASELKELFDDYESYIDTPSDMSVIYGCDCGCGGDMYTSKEWNEAHEKSHEVKEDLKKALEELGVEWDLDCEEGD